MRRIRIIVTLAVLCFTGLALASNAAAGNFDEGAMGCTGEDPATCPAATVGQPYSLTLYLTRDSPSDPPRGGDFDCATFHVTSGSFPPGLSISDEGTISGTPTVAGSYGFYLTVRYDKTPSCGKTPSDDRFIINVNAPPQRLVVQTSSLPDANIGQPYTAPALSAAGGTVSSWSVASGTLPTGLTLNSTNGVISGTPSQSGVFTFTVQANGSPNNDSKQLTVFVLAPLDLGLAPAGTPVAAQPTVVNMKLATPVSWGVKATGGREPYTYSADTLPAGITLNADGTVTGTPTLAGQTKSTITVKDARGTADTLQVTFTTKALLAFHKTKQPRAGKVGTLYSWRLPVAGASETKVFLVSGAIPPGLSLDEATGLLSGTPLTAGTFKVKFWVLGDAGTQISKTYKVKIQGVKRITASR
jgi:large repetitive protein